jgi:hypothetical protein
MLTARKSVCERNKGEVEGHLVNANRGVGGWEGGNRLPLATLKRKDTGHLKEADMQSKEWCTAAAMQRSVCYWLGESQVTPAARESSQKKRLLGVESFGEINDLG